SPGRSVCEWRQDDHSGASVGEKSARKTTQGSQMVTRGQKFVIQTRIFSSLLGFIFGSEDRGRRAPQGAHRRWWKGLWKNHRSYRCKIGEMQRGPLIRPWAPRCFYRLSKAGGKS